MNVTATNRGVATWPVAVCYFGIRQSIMAWVRSFPGLNSASRHILLGTSYQLIERAFASAVNASAVFASARESKLYGDVCVSIALPPSNVDGDRDEMRGSIRNAYASRADKATFILAELQLLRHFAKACAPFLQRDTV